MKKQHKSLLILLLTAMIWGFAFVAQLIGANSVGSFTFNAARFTLGGLSLVPVVLIFERRKTEKSRLRTTILSGMAAGIVLFAASTLQQLGVMYTGSAGKAGFLTGIYTVIVPIIGIFLKHRTNINNWIGAGIGAAGLFFLCVTSDFTVATGDILLLAGSLGWAAQIFIIDYFAPKVNAAKLISVQFFVAGLLSLTVALITETNTLEAVISSIPSLLYTGIMSSGIAYTLQTVGQKYAKPATASVILSTESLFGALAGFVFLNEVMRGRELLGCGLMMTAVIIAQLPARKKLMAHAEALK